MAAETASDGPVNYNTISGHLGKHFGFKVTVKKLTTFQVQKTLLRALP